METDTADIDAQIAALQAQKARKLELAERARLAWQEEEAKVLIGSTPTKAVKHTPADDLPTRPAPPRFSTGSSLPSGQASSSRLTLADIPAKPSASRLSSSLAAMRQKTGSVRKDALPVVRSSSFYAKKRELSASKSVKSPVARPGPPIDKGKAKSASPEEGSASTEVPRDEDSLTIINRLELGPKAFGKDPEGEDLWEHVEPNSRIRLAKRLLSHEIVQDHLRGRYFLPPSLLYSVIRLSRDGATYDVPVEGDWVTIAVVAERSEVRISGAKEAAASESEEEVEGAEGNKKRKQGDKDLSQVEKSRNRWQKRRGPRKYINLKLVSLPPRASSLSGKGTMGDALLQLLLFESDAKIHEKEKDDDGNEKFRYQGGSGGAYEKWCNLMEGTVVAILNPRVLRPLKSGSQAPHPLTLPLALNPTSADSIFVIGQARDLGRCSAEQKDGNRCRTWVDLRQSQVCEYHIHAAVSRGRSGRAEFTASTSGFDLSTRPFAAKGGNSGKYDPKRKQGLQPNRGAQSGQGDAGATYIVGGNAVHMRTDGGLKSFGDEHLSEKLGRGRAERKRRKLEEKAAEEALSKLLEKDGNNGSTGAKYLAKIGRQVPQSAKPSEKGKRTTEPPVEDLDRKRPFGVTAVRRIGFDPTARAGQRDDEDQAKRMESIASLKDPDRPIKLGRPSGTSRSNVKAPSVQTAEARPHDGNENGMPGSDDNTGDMIDLD